MVIRLYSAGIEGVDAYPIELEIDYARKGLPSFTMVGLAETAVKEAKERVNSALRSANFFLPPARITVNLAPANKRKSGTAYDLPLAVGLIAAAGLIEQEKIAKFIFAGELSLSGELKPVSGILPLAILARNKNFSGIIVPPANAAEAAVVKDLNVYAPTSLAEAIAFLLGEQDLEKVATNLQTNANIIQHIDYAEVKGQKNAKRAIEIAAAGGHNILMIGPPGSGKTMLAQRLPTILPTLSFEEALEVTKIYSVADKLASGQGLIINRPFRAPHHTISEVALVGGGQHPRPGEVSLAHRGVLFLDELAEYNKNTLEVLRQPLEDGVVSIARAAQSVTYPAACMLVAAMNPCPCGYLGSQHHTCTCRQEQIIRYRSKISGPLLDRIDVHIEVPAVPYSDLKTSYTANETSEKIRERVEFARALQLKRYQKTKTLCNANLSGKLLEQHCSLDQESQKYIENAINTLGLSARAYTRLLRLARTIADLEAATAKEDSDLPIQKKHISQAVALRVLDRESQYSR